MDNLTSDHALTNPSIEDAVARVPTDLFLWAAAGSILGSLIFKALDREDEANFIGHWAPTFLALGIFSKLIKTRK